MNILLKLRQISIIRNYNHFNLYNSYTKLSLNKCKKFKNFNKYFIRSFSTINSFKSNLSFDYDVIVVGGGHAGCESASGILN